MVVLTICLFSINIFADDENNETESNNTAISSFTIKAYNPLNEELILGETDSYHGDVVYVKIFDETGAELDLDLFDFERSNGIVPYTGYPTGQFITNRLGKQTITAILKEDNT